MTIDSKAALPAEEEARAATVLPSINIMSSSVQGSTTEADEMDAAAVIVAAFKNLLEAEQRRPRVATRLVTFALQFATAVLRPHTTTTVHQYLAKMCQLDGTGRRAVDISKADAVKVRHVLRTLLTRSSPRSGASESTPNLPLKAIEFCDAVMHRIELGRLVYGHWRQRRRRRRRRARPLESMVSDDNDDDDSMTTMWTFVRKECISRCWCRGPPYYDDWKMVEAFLEGCGRNDDDDGAEEDDEGEGAGTAWMAPDPDEAPTTTTTTATTGVFAERPRGHPKAENEYKDAPLVQDAEGNVADRKRKWEPTPFTTIPPLESLGRESPRLASFSLPTTPILGGACNNNSDADETSALRGSDAPAAGSPIVGCNAFAADGGTTQLVGTGSEFSPFEWRARDDDDNDNGGWMDSRTLAHPGQPLLVGATASGGSNSHDDVVDDKDDEWHIRRLLGLARRPYCPVTRTFLPVPTPAVRPPSSIQLPPVRKGASTTILGQDNPVGSTVSPPTAGPPPDGVGKLKQRRTRDRNQEENYLPHHEVEGLDVTRRASSPFVALDNRDENTEDANGISIVADPCPDDAPATDLGFSATCTAIDYKRRVRPLIAEENWAFAAPQFVEEREGSVMCAVCESRVSSTRGTIPLLTHALSTKCLIRRVALKVLPATQTTSSFAAAALVEQLDGTVVTGALRALLGRYIDEKTPTTVHPCGTVAPPLCSWRCRACSGAFRTRSIDFALRHLSSCLGIVRVIHAVEAVLVPIVSRVLCPDHEAATDDTAPPRRDSCAAPSFVAVIKLRHRPTSARD